MTFAVTYEQFWQRRDTEANWVAVNPVLHDGEFGVVLGTANPLLYKLGDGVTAWNDLPYLQDHFAVGSGTNTITATINPTPVLYDGMTVNLRAAGANTGAVTFNPNSLGALAVTKFGGTVLAVGDISGAGHELILRYRSSVPRWELLNPTPPTGSGAAPAGSVIGYAYTQSSTTAASTSVIPADDTIPQIGEGAAYAALDTTITPQYTTSLLEVEVVIPWVAGSSSRTPIFALFRDSGANAIASTWAMTLGAAGVAGACVVMRAIVAAGSVSATTFKVRFGPDAAGTVCCMQLAAGTTFFGASDVATMTAVEVKQ